LTSFKPEVPVAISQGSYDNQGDGVRRKEMTRKAKTQTPLGFNIERRSKTDEIPLSEDIPMMEPADHP
jgi:hypothetical protein